MQFQTSNAKKKKDEKDNREGGKLCRAKDIEV